MRRHPVETYPCDCGRQAVAYVHSEPVCARCLELHRQSIHSHEAKARQSGIPALVVHHGSEEFGFRSGQIDWEHYHLPEDFGKPIAGIGESLEILERWLAHPEAMAA